jgi:hypothetical protein
VEPEQQGLPTPLAQTFRQTLAKQRIIRILSKPSHALVHEFATLYVLCMMKYAHHGDATI